MHLIYTAAPFKALDLGADPLALGSLAAASTGTYALLVAASGRTSDRVSRLALARSSCIGIIAACIGLTLAGRVGHLLLCIPLVGGSMAFFWPCVQASIADRSDPRALERDLGRFNLSWSVGKGAGFLLGGAILAALGPGSTFTLASCIAFAIFFVLPVQNGGAPPAAPPSPHHADPRAALYRRLGWVANCAAHGLGATLVYHYPRVISAHGWSPRAFGLFLGLVYLTQTVTFLVLMRRPELWRFQRWRLYIPQVLMAAAVLSLPLAGPARLGVSALVFGFGLGICYCSSIYYSLLVHAGRGRNAGVHEALIGLGDMLVPFGGGFLARWLGLDWMPYATAAAAVAIALLLQETLYRTGTRAQTGPH